MADAEAFEPALRTGIVTVADDSEGAVSSKPNPTERESGSVENHRAGNAGAERSEEKVIGPEIWMRIGEGLFEPMRGIEPFDASSGVYQFTLETLELLEDRANEVNPFDPT